MLDAVLLEKRGVPAASVGEEYLVKSVGMAMQKLHGMPDHPIATFQEVRQLGIMNFEEEVRPLIKSVIPQIEAILVQK